MGFATLRDALVGREVPCRMRGCTRTWLWRKEDQFKAGSGGKPALEPPKRMCEPCAARAQGVEDREVGCSKASCEHRWKWSKFAQVEAWLRAGEKEPTEPRGFCDACRTAVAEKGDREVKCRVRTCTKTWLWTGRAQLLAGDGAPPPERMCEACEGQFRDLQAQDLPCKIRGCKRTWGWSKWSQLEHAASGKKDAPSRMCDPCAHRYSQVADREVPCRIKGCDKTWTWSRGSQLEVEASGGGAPPAPRREGKKRGRQREGAPVADVQPANGGAVEPGVGDVATPAAAEAPVESAPAPDPGPTIHPPERMCAEHHLKFQQLQDQQVPCKRRGCTGTWLWKRGEQLVARGEGAPQRFCEACIQGMSQHQDRDMPCEHKQDGCTGHWVWTRLAQYAAAVQGRKDHPPHHACPACADFLRTAQTVDLHCTRCSASIHWPPENQLKTKLGKFVEPKLCGACKAAETHAPAGA